jgi:hypothetical protein
VAVAAQSRGSGRAAVRLRPDAAAGGAQAGFADFYNLRVHSCKGFAAPRIIVLYRLQFNPCEGFS